MQRGKKAMNKEKDEYYMEYLFLNRKKTTATSGRQKTLLFKAAEREWEHASSERGGEGRKVDGDIYKNLLYELEIKQVFLDTSLSLKKLSEMLETNQTYVSNVVNRYFGCNLKELLNTYRVEWTVSFCQGGWHCNKSCKLYFGGYWCC